MPRFAIQATVACFAFLIFCVTDSTTEAQIFRRSARVQQQYYQPQVIHYSHPTVSHTVVNHTAPDCAKKSHHGCKQAGCNGGCGGCHCNPPCPDPHCCENICDCRPKVTPSTGCVTVECEKFKITPPKCCDTIEENIPFYCGKEDKEGYVEVPVKVCRTIESFRFEKRTFEICGCKLTVCVPCEIVKKKCNRCEMKMSKVKMVARIRTNPAGAPKRADIWVYGAKGLPSIAVVATNVTAKQANKMFKSSFVY